MNSYHDLVAKKKNWPIYWLTPDFREKLYSNADCCLQAGGSVLMSHRTA